MNTLDFLQHVLPPEGIYATAVFANGAHYPQHAFFSTVEDLATNCQRSDKLGNNTYYALSSFKTKAGGRRKTNQHLTKVVAMDVDCAPEKVDQVDNEGKPIPDKGYLNQKLGLAALQKFIRDFKLPMPMIVSSGRGLHVYWVLDKALPSAEWEPLAEAMKRAALNSGFIIDPAVTADSARILRPTGTHNPRNGKEVKVLLPAALTDRHTLENLLQNVEPTGGDKSVTYVSPPVGLAGRTSAIADALATTYAPTKADAVTAKCQQVRWAVKNQAKVSEPLWYALMGVAAFCEAPENTAIDWSKNHPEYDQAKTINKVRQWKANATGPSTCTRFSTERASGCDKCPVRGNVVSPAQLGAQYVEAAVAPDAPDAVAREVPLPWKVKRHTPIDRPTRMMQEIDGTDVEICPFEIYPVGYGRDASLGYETVRYKWKRRHVGWQDLVFRQALLNMGNNEFPTTIADQGIMLKGKKQVEGFQNMLRNYMDNLRNIKTMSNIHGSMGWKEDFTQFVVGDKLYRREPDGSIIEDDISLTASSSRLGNSLYGHVGSVQEWSKATAILETANMPWHIFALLHGFSSPLWPLTGLKGVTVSLHGGTGCGKSVIQQWIQSIWGNPDKLHISAKGTHNALFNRLGVYCNLPMTIDEATHMQDVGDFCYWVTEGEDKKRLTRTAEERETKEWATNVIVSTNTSFISKMAATGHETDAQMARLFEVNIPAHKMFDKSSTAGRTIAQFLMRNYGVVGGVIAKAYLRRGKTEMQRLISKATVDFPTIYGCAFIGSERYWETNLVLIHVAGQIALEEGLIAFNPTIGIQWAVDQLDKMRYAMEDNKVDGFDLIKEYLNETAKDVLTVYHTKGQHPNVDPYRVPRGEVKARFDVYRTDPMGKYDRGTVMIVRKQFKQWVSSRGYDFNTLRSEVAKENIDATPHTKRISISKDTSLKIGQQYVLGINLNHPYMNHYLDVAQQTADEMTLGEMTVVP